MDILGGRQGGGINKTKEGIVGGNSRALWQDTINETGGGEDHNIPGRRRGKESIRQDMCNYNFPPCGWSKTTIRIPIALKLNLKKPCLSSIHFINHSTQTSRKDRVHIKRLILLLIIISSGLASLISLLQVLPADAAWLATSERRADGEVDVLLRVQSDDERGDVHHLLADTAIIQGRNKNISQFALPAEFFLRLFSVGNVSHL